METEVTQSKFWDNIGFPKCLIWGYVGVVLFMIGCGLEQSWLSSYLVGKGMSSARAASLFTVYGIMVAASAWFSGIGVQLWGVRKIMGIGLAIFLIVSIPFIAIAIPTNNYPLLLLTYMFRGLGYPLFAYTFLVWVTYRTRKAILGRAVSWFWVVFTCGLNVIGPWYSSFNIPNIGEINVLWTGIVFVIVGGFFALVVNRDKLVLPECSGSKVKEMGKASMLAFTNPKVGMGGIVRIFLSIGQFSFALFVPMYMAKFGYSLSDWLQIWGVTFILNLIFNVIFGFASDKMGWRNTIFWFGCIGCCISTLAIYFVPIIFGYNYWMMMFATCLHGIMLSGFVPLSALVVSLAPNEKGAAMSVLNLGAGISAFVGPAIVNIFIGPLGATGVFFIFAGLYVFIAIVTRFLKASETEEVDTTVQHDINDGSINID